MRCTDTDGQRSIKVLECNCPLGDSECQSIMKVIKNDRPAVFEHALDGTLDQAEIEWDRRTALGDVLAAHGYPGTPRQGDAITRLAPDTDERMTFHASTAWEQDTLVTHDGRVLCVPVLADSVRRTQPADYDSISPTHFDGRHYRNDIGSRAHPPAKPCSYFLITAPAHHRL